MQKQENVNLAYFFRKLRFLSGSFETPANVRNWRCAIFSLQLIESLLKIPQMIRLFKTFLMNINTYRWEKCMLGQYELKLSRILPGEKPFLWGNSPSRGINSGFRKKCLNQKLFLSMSWKK